MRYESKGVLYYNPKRGKNQDASWWLILDVDKELTRYYRWWVMREFGLRLHEPSWNAHATIVRGEAPPNIHAWKKYEGREIVFSVQHVVRQAGDTTGWDRPDCYWFVDIFSSELSMIREELGFPPKEKYHITIGRTY
jgi:hypothetical protein